MSQANTLLDRALELPAAERARLVRQLLLSLEPDTFDADADDAWAAEIEARLDRAGEGESAGADWREVIDRVRRSIRSRSAP